MVSQVQVRRVDEPAGKAKRIALYRSATRLARDPLSELVEIGRRADGELVRLDLGLFRPYLVTDPDHVQQIFVDNADNYQREGLLWSPVRNLIGDGLAGEGPAWTVSHQTVQPLFSGRYIDSLIDAIAGAAAAELDELAPAARAGQPVDIYAAMTRIVNRVVVRAFFGNRLSVPDAHLLRDSLMAAFKSLGPRMLLPFVPTTVPLPGYRAYRRAARTADDIMSPLVRAARQSAEPDTDLVSLLCQSRDESGEPFDDPRVRYDLKAMFVAGGETAAAMLTWLWVVFDRYPDVAARMREEVAAVVGDQRPRREHLARLTYTRMVLEELLRLYPAGWMLPRRAKRGDVLGGVRLKAGSTVLISPYVIHRLPSLWERPDTFEPERFVAGHARHRHKFAYLPFGGGPHACLGPRFFTVEAQIVAATMLSRYRPERASDAPVPVLPRVSLQPGGKVPMLLRPVDRS